ncbi:MAG: 4-alpha-glucanotransferase [Candidatus Omnitrophica bacterium]|nr:4-alpha-glucanotransferase [Candidatus Omnitrophota bacterium]MBU1870321.1 4-alpha-glucanotransferase [Candidatus Omnitrophota bacterium]
MSDSNEKWARIQNKKRSGLLVPLFSVYSKKSLGIGDFEDLKLLIDWTASTGNSILQLLPMNEMGAVSCPYDSISSFALEPVYLSLRSFPATEDKTIKKEIEALRSRFSVGGAAHLDYAIKKEKMRLLWKIYCLQEDFDNEEFNRFMEENHYWLFNFCLFKALKEYHHGKAWYDWDEKFREREWTALEEFKKEHEKEIVFQMWVQWQAFKQFRDAKAYAQSKNILLKGDLPILVSRDSADVWAHRDFFKLEFAAGAPPDMYCAKGQRWGMPTYDWAKIKENGFWYLKEKLKYAENFYDILRIDHVVGLFRIWSIPYNEPAENQGLNGFFDPRDEPKWGGHGKEILQVILDGTKMLLCAEDLGVIPRVCIDTLKELGIPGNDVERWVKDWDVRHDFLSPDEYRRLSVAMLSTHDTTNWPAWWENEAGTVDEGLFIRKCNDRGINFHSVKAQLFDPAFSGHGRLRWKNEINSEDNLIWILGKRKEEVRDFIDIYLNTYLEKEKLWRQLGLKGAMREASDARIVRAALKITLDSKAVFCVNTIIDWLYIFDIWKGDPYQYRTNTPGTVSEKNWSLVLPVSLEDLLKHKASAEIKKMVTASGR